MNERNSMYCNIERIISYCAHVIEKYIGTDRCRECATLCRYIFKKNGIENCFIEEGLVTYDPPTATGKKYNNIKIDSHERLSVEGLILDFAILQINKFGFSVNSTIFSNSSYLKYYKNATISTEEIMYRLDTPFEDLHKETVCIRNIV